LTTTPQPFYGPFSRTTWVSRCQKRTSGLFMQGKINRGRHTDQSAETLSDALISLQWLWAPERILYKMAVLTHKALHGGSPRYLSSLVHVADVSGRPALRSAGSNHLRIPPFKLSTIGGRAFPVTRWHHHNNRGSRHPIVANYSFINLERMKD